MIRLRNVRHLGHVLHALRVSQGLGTHRVASRAHISRSGLCKRETRGSATLPVLLEHLAALGCDVAIVPSLRPGVRPTGTGWPE